MSLFKPSSYQSRHGHGPEPIIPRTQRDSEPRPTTAPTTDITSANQPVTDPEPTAVPVADSTGTMPAVVGDDHARAPRTSAARSSLIMFLGTFTSRLLGMVRSPILLGAVVGLQSPVANSFDVANKLPTLLYMIIAGGLVNAVLVPAIVRAMKESKDDGQAFINKLLTLSVVVLGATTLVLTLAAPLIVKLYAATMSDEWYKLTVLFAFWCLPQVFFYGMYTIFGQILNARENFGPYMWAPVVNNIIAIGGLLIMLAMFGTEDTANASSAAAWFGTRANMLGAFSTLGIAAQALVLIIPMYRSGIRFKPDFRWRGSGLGTAGRASTWVLATMLVGMLPTIIQSNVAAGATERAKDLGIALTEVAGNFAYTTAYSVYSLPTSLITVSITTAMFTRLAKAATSGHLDRVRADTSLTLRAVSTFMFLASAGLIVLAVPLSRIFVPAVTEGEVLSLARVITVLAFGLVGVGATSVFNKVYYALEDTRTAFFVGLPWQIFGIVGFALASFLPPQWVVPAVGAVMASANLLGGLVTYLLLSRRLGGIDGRRILISHAKLAAIAVVVTLLGYKLVAIVGTDRLTASFVTSVATIAVVAPIMSLAYIVLMRAARMEEADTLMNYIHRMTARLRRR